MNIVHIAIAVALGITIERVARSVIATIILRIIK